MKDLVNTSTKTKVFALGGKVNNVGLVEVPMGTTLRELIYDIGGAYGEYAWWLASLGYEVHLFDLAEGNIAMSIFAPMSMKSLNHQLLNASLCARIPR